MSFLRQTFLRQTFLPAAAGIAVFASSIIGPVGVSYMLADAGLYEERDAPKVASFAALVGLFAGAYSASAVHSGTRRRLALRGPRTEAETVERYLLDNLFGGVPLVNISVSVSARGDDFDISIRNGTHTANKPNADGEYPYNSLHDRLGRLGFDPSGLKLLGGGEMQAYPHYAVVQRLHYSVTRESLPPALKRELQSFRTAQQAPVAVAYNNL